MAPDTRPGTRASASATPSSRCSRTCPVRNSARRRKSATFLEIGFDSLFLTQATRELQNKFGIKIAFRQLLGDLSTFDALARFADEKLPADNSRAHRAGRCTRPRPRLRSRRRQTCRAPRLRLLPAPLQQPGSLTATADGATAAERVMRDQLQVMNSLFAAQLGVLQGTMVAANGTPTRERHQRRNEAACASGAGCASPSGGNEHGHAAKEPRRRR